MGQIIKTETLVDLLFLLVITTPKDAITRQLFNDVKEEIERVIVNRVFNSDKILPQCSCTKRVLAMRVKGV